MAHDVNPERMRTRLKRVEEHLQRLNAHDLDGLVGTYGTRAALVLNGEYHPGREGIRILFSMLYADFPDLHIEPRRSYLASDTVIAEAVLHAGLGKPARGPRLAGRRLEIPMCGLFHFDDDEKLAETSFYFDGALLLRQMGRLPLAA